MKCLICQENAEWYCSCQNTPLCNNHSMSHRVKQGHLIEPINLSLSASKSNNLKKEVFNRLNKIKKSKSQISFLVKTITLKLENSSKAALKKLDSLCSFYSSLLYFDKWPRSLTNEVDKMLSTSLNIKKISIELNEIIEEAFNQDFISFSAKDEPRVKNEKIADKKIREDVISIVCSIDKIKLSIDTKQIQRKNPIRNKILKEQPRERIPFRSILIFSFFLICCVVIFSYLSEYRLISLFGLCPTISQFQQNQLKGELIQIEEYNELDKKNYDISTLLETEILFEKEIEINKHPNSMLLWEKKEYIKLLNIDYFYKWFINPIFRMHVKEIKFSHNRKFAFICNFYTGKY